MSAEPNSGRGGMAALVGLSLLEVIRTRDLPTEILGSENPSQTMPRRLGLSEAVDLQIRRFRTEVKKRGRISDDEAKAFFALVLRRPDAGEVFFQAGGFLAGKDLPARGVGRWYPRRVRFAMARRYFRKRSRALFGRTVGGFSHGPFALESGGHLLLEMDPGGNACTLLSGFAESVLSRYLRMPATVIHSACLARGQDSCRWTFRESGAVSDG
jgi:hypothetical protein